MSDVLDQKLDGDLNNINLTDKQKIIYNRFLDFILDENISNKILSTDNGNGLYNVKKTISKKWYFCVFNELFPHIWAETKEGHIFWKDIDNKWCNCLAKEFDLNILL